MTTIVHTFITLAQLKKLQVLYGQYARRSLNAGTPRQERLNWASERVGRSLVSFNEITVDEAIRLIDDLQAELGVALPQKPKSSFSYRRKSKRDAQQAGTEGRHDQKPGEVTLVSDADIRRIQRMLDTLGWDQARLTAFLASPKGPNRRRTEIRTLGDANRVYWALKRMVPRKAKPGEAVTADEVPF
jgi:hypothetical protein